MSNKDGFSETMIFYNNKLSDNDRIFNIIHEFSHILLEHKAYNGVVGHSMLVETLKTQEDEANEFTCEVLAPSCVFKKLNINSIEDMKLLCQLSHSHAKSHIVNITNFNSLEDLCQKIITIFDNYIKNKKNVIEDINNTTLK